MPASRDFPLVGSDAAVLGAAADWVGFGVAVIEDMDFDGGAELLVGAPRSDAPATTAGSAGLFLSSSVLARSSFVLANTADVLFLGEGSYQSAGSVVAATGDRDGDGAGDLAIGAPGVDRSRTDVGAIYLWSGR